MGGQGPAWLMSKDQPWNRNSLGVNSACSTYWLGDSGKWLLLSASVSSSVKCGQWLPLHLFEEVMLCSKCSMKNQCRDGYAAGGQSPSLSRFSCSPTPVSMVGLAWSPGMTSTAPALPTSQGPHVPSSCGVLASPASRLPPVRRSLMALSVSMCPGQPTCWVLDTQPALGPTPNLRAHRRPGCQQFQPSVVEPLLPAGQAF